VVGYPIVPAVFIAASCYLVINALITDPKWTSITFAVVLAGLPVYWLVFRSRVPDPGAVKVRKADL
jgi:ABC-type spermidine/putrescine transport system permease subunit II